MMSDMAIKQALEHVDEKGRTWNLYGVDFESPDGKYSVYLHAISFDHAELQLEALKETGKIYGVIRGVVDAGERG